MLSAVLNWSVYMSYSPIRVRAKCVQGASVWYVVAIIWSVRKLWVRILVTSYRYLKVKLANNNNNNNNGNFNSNWATKNRGTRQQKLYLAAIKLEQRQKNFELAQSIVFRVRAEFELHIWCSCGAVSYGRTWNSPNQILSKSYLCNDQEYKASKTPTVYRTSI